MPSSRAIRTHRSRRRRLARSARGPGPGGRPPRVALAQVVGRPEWPGGGKPRALLTGVTKATTMWFGTVLAGDLVHPRTPGRAPVAAEHGSVRGWGQTSLEVRPSPPDVVPQNVRRAARAPGARAHRERRHAHARSRTITPRSGRCEDARRAHSAPSDAGWRHLADSGGRGPSRWTATRPGTPTRQPADPATAAPAPRPGTQESRLLTMTPNMRSGLPSGCRPMARPPTRPCQMVTSALSRSTTPSRPRQQASVSSAISPSSSVSVYTPQVRQGNQGSASALGTDQVPKGLPGEVRFRQNRGQAPGPADRLKHVSQTPGGTPRPSRRGAAGGARRCRSCRPAR